MVNLLACLCRSYVLYVLHLRAPFVKTMINLFIKELTRWQISLPLAIRVSILSPLVSCPSKYLSKFASVFSKIDSVADDEALLILNMSFLS